MSRLTLALVLLVGLLAGGLGVTLLDRGAPNLGEAEVRGIVSDMLAAQAPAPAPQLDTATVNGLIEEYLMSDPGILERMGTRLAETRKVAARQAQAELIAANHDAIFADTRDVVVGNPEGDVTLVELFDYNCSYCRNALPDLATLLAEDENLRVVLKDYPILTAGSLEAARVAALVAEDESLNYWEFHQRLFSQRGDVGAAQALDAAEAVGGNRVALMIDMNGRAAAEAVERTYKLAQALNITGTPTYILGDELIPGALGIDALRTKIANVRACGSTSCAPAG